MTWGWRLFALVLFVIAAVAMSKIYWALASNGYVWTMVALIAAPIAIGYFVDWRRSKAALD